MFPTSCFIQCYYKQTNQSEEKTKTPPPSRAWNSRVLEDEQATFCTIHSTQRMMIFTTLTNNPYEELIVIVFTNNLNNSTGEPG